MHNKHYKIKQPIEITVDMQSLVESISEIISEIVADGVSEQCDAEFESRNYDTDDEDMFALIGAYVCEGTVISSPGTMIEPPDSEMTRDVEVIDEKKLLAYVRLKLSEKLPKEFSDKLNLILHEDSNNATYDDIS